MFDFEELQVLKKSKNDTTNKMFEKQRYSQALAGAHFLPFIVDLVLNDR